MRRPYICENCGAVGLSGERGFLPRRCIECLPPKQRAYRERLYPAYKARGDKYRARYTRSNARTKDPHAQTEPVPA